MADDMKAAVDPDKVTTGSPDVGASCFMALLDSTVKLPDTASEELATGWMRLGELSENGYTKSTSTSANKFKGWHGTTLLAQVASEENTFKCEFVEVDGGPVNILRYGKDAVKTDDTGNIVSIDPTVTPNVAVALVFDELLSNGRKRRTVFPRATIDSIDDEAHSKGALLVYGMTFSANVDANGHPYYVREAKPAAPSASAKKPSSNQ